MPNQKSYPISGLPMGNTQARNRLKAQDFAYIAKNTAFLTNDVIIELI